MRRLSRVTPVARRHFASRRTIKPTNQSIKASQTRPSQQNARLPSRVSAARAGAPSKSKRDYGAPRHQSKTEVVSTALAQAQSSDLVTAVHIPDDPEGILHKDHPAMSILNNSALVMQRQIEMMNVFLGFEQANKYVIMNGEGQTVGYLAEQDHGLGSAMMRQMARTHRSFTAHIFDLNEREVLRIDRPFTWINSKVRVYDPISGSEYTSGDNVATTLDSQTSSVPATLGQSPLSRPTSDMPVVGEVQQIWAPLKRKYDLFTYRPLTPTPSASPSSPARLSSGDSPNTTSTSLTTTETQSEQALEAGMSQFASISSPFLSWNFTLLSQSSSVIGSVNRSFSGFAREIFTDTGVYALRMDSASAAASNGLQEVSSSSGEGQSEALTLDQRAVMLATAVSIDFDYFSRHSHAGAGGFMPLWIPGMGGGEAGAGAGAGAAGAEAGAVEGAAGGAMGTAGRGAVGGAGEAGVMGAGGMAGYEAMQRGAGRGGADDASPTSGSDYGGLDGDQKYGGGQRGEEVWGQGDDPFDGAGKTGGGGASGDGEGGWFDDVDVGDWF